MVSACDAPEPAHRTKDPSHARALRCLGQRWLKTSTKCGWIEHRTTQSYTTLIKSNTVPGPSNSKQLILASSAGTNSTPWTKVEIHAQQTPLTAGPKQIENGVHYSPYINASGTPPPGFPSGIIESTNAHCASVKSVEEQNLAFCRKFTAVHAPATLTYNSGSRQSLGVRSRGFWCKFYCVYVFVLARRLCRF